MKMKPIYMNTGVLAYIGDAAYELHIRRHIVGRGLVRADRLHSSAVRFVRADAQAGFIRKILHKLPEEEVALVKRARNHKISSKPKNANPVDYKWATAFEALLGYYYLSGQEEKLEETIEGALEYIGGEKNEQG